MIKHFLSSQSEVKYWLYAHFGQKPPSGTNWITLDFLRTALKKVSPSVTVSDDQLNMFSSKFEFVLGDKFEDLELKAKTELSKELSCKISDVDYYYYNNAIAYIAKISTERDITQRVINKKLFLSHINKKIHLFDSWLKELKGKNEYIKHIRNQLKNGALNNTKRKFIFISKSILCKVNWESQLKNFLMDLINEYPLIGELHNTKIWTVVVQMEKDEFSVIKKYLIKNNVFYNDGYEDILFSSYYFNSMPIINSKKDDKVDKTSHSLRLITKETFEKELKNIISHNQQPNTYINLSSNFDDNQFFVNDGSVVTYTLTAIDNLSDLSAILKRGK